MTEREAAVLGAMIDHGVTHDDPQPTDSDRASWRAVARHLVVDDVCRCGQCPSVSLALPDASPQRTDAPRTIVDASLPDALVMLFIDAGVPSYLELAPLGEATTYESFPAPAQLAF